MKIFQNLILGVLYLTYADIIISQENSFQLNVELISEINWASDGVDGFEYKQVPGANLGVTSFELVSSETTAYLSNANNFVYIVNNTSGEIENSFEILPFPRDFKYENLNFYVLYEKSVVQYDKNGKVIKLIEFPSFLKGVERITRHNNSTYLLLPNGNSFRLDESKNTEIQKEIEGWICENGNSIKCNILANDVFSIKLQNGEDITMSKEITINGKLASVMVIGSTSETILLDIQLYQSENPIVVKRGVISINYSFDGITDVLCSKETIDCYYVLSMKDYCINEDGIVYNMVSSPKGLYLFKLDPSYAGIQSDYPKSLKETKYHFNDHLLYSE